MHKTPFWSGIAAAGLLLSACSDSPASRGAVPRSAGPTPPAVRHYVAHRAIDSVVIDGNLDDSSWTVAPWTEWFVDIEGDRQPSPEWQTRVAMVWDDRALYIAAVMEEPHLWATITERDAVIYRDNDFEVFLDPDSDTHAYYELEINALGTVWDLFLDKPYRDGGSAVNEWDIGGLESAVALEGTLNDPADRDRGWSVELAIPWSGLVGPEGVAESAPVAGDIWRANFSRVQWQLDPVGAGYAKRTDRAGKVLPEDNWVWSPQDAINMHMPEMWGRIQFTDHAVGDEPVSVIVPADDAVRWRLRRVYYAQRAQRRETGRYLEQVGDLGLDPTGAGIEVDQTGAYRAWATDPQGVTWWIDQEGRVWRE